MIQRIQSIYLFLCSLTVALMFCWPLAFIKGYSEEFSLTTQGIFLINGEQKESTLIIAAFLILEILFSLSIIFFYKKRSLQIILGKLNLLFLTLLIGVVFYYADRAKLLTGLPNDSLVNYQLPCLFPVISIILNYLAIRAIKKDDDLVRAADRLR